MQGFVSSPAWDEILHHKRAGNTWGMPLRRRTHMRYKTHQYGAKPVSEALYFDFRQLSVNSPSKLPNVHLFLKSGESTSAPHVADARRQGFYAAFTPGPEHLPPFLSADPVTRQRPPVLRAQRTTGPTPRPRAQGERYMDLVSGCLCRHGGPDRHALRLRPTVRVRPPMTALYWLGGLIGRAVFAYLAYALFNPEKF